MQQLKQKQRRIELMGSVREMLVLFLMDVHRTLMDVHRSGVWETAGTLVYIRF